MCTPTLHRRAGGRRAFQGPAGPVETIDQAGKAEPSRASADLLAMVSAVKAVPNERDFAGNVIPFEAPAAVPNDSAAAAPLSEHYREMVATSPSCPMRTPSSNPGSGLPGAAVVVAPDAEIDFNAGGRICAPGRTMSMVTPVQNFFRRSPAHVSATR